MAIKRKLDAGDLAVLELVEDEIWFPEFLRTTSDGESDKNLWPPTPWKHRDYQRMILTDKSKFISLTGGRAIGKCEPGNARILTVDGYQYLRDLVKLPSFLVYSLTPDQKLAQRRARALPNGRKNTYTITTETGHEITVTPNHPVLTEDGWKPAEEITQGEKVAVITHIPYDTHNVALRWHELRWLGYVLLSPYPIKIGSKFKPKFKKIGKELEVIADRFSTIWHKDEDGVYSFHRIKGPLLSPIRALYIETDIFGYTSYGKSPDFIPTLVMREGNENVKIFLEALFAQYGQLDAKSVSIKASSKRMSLQIQELLLRFGIETRIDNNVVSLLEYEDVFNFWNIFKLPGVGLTQLAVPEQRPRINSFMRLDTVRSIVKDEKRSTTYAIYVYEDNNYISSNIFVHNTVILEDKIIYEIVNYDKEFPMTPEQVLATANQAQLTPLLNKLIQRFTGSRFLSGFLFGNGSTKGGINKADGTMVFPVRAKPFTFFFRIAGSKGEQNMVGLHIPRIKIDEAQIFPPTAFTQLLPAFNHWEPKTQLFVAGVKW